MIRIISLPLARRQLPSEVTGTFAVLRLLPRVSFGLTVALAGTIAASTILPLAFTVVSGFLVGSIPPAVQSGPGTLWVSPAGHHALLLLAVAGVLSVVYRVVGPFEAAVAAVFGRRIDRHLQERVMEAVGRPSGIRHLEDPKVLNLIENAQGVGTHGFRPGDAVTGLASLLPSWFQALGSAAILATFHWWLGLGWILLWPIVLYFLQREYIRVGQAATGEMDALRRADYFRDLALKPAAAKELRVWGLGDWLIARFGGAWLDAMAPVWRARTPGRTVVWVSSGVVLAASLASYGLLAWSGVHGLITLAALAVYTRATIDAGTFRAFDDANMNLAYAAVAVPSLIDLERKLEDPARSGGRALQAGSPQKTIRFERLSFRYEGGSSDALHDLDLEIPAGRSLAIVGANGAGKTTLVKLLCRLYEPTRGRIVVDGIDLQGIEPDIWRARVAAIFQDFTHYQLSARENVALGALPEGLTGRADPRRTGPPPASVDGAATELRDGQHEPRRGGRSLTPRGYPGRGPSTPDAHAVGRDENGNHGELPLPEAGTDGTGRGEGVVDGALRGAARRAGALELIEGLPGGWDTVLSRQYTGGVDLSGGQWQRIALARALFAVEGGARVLILDEPTANLDVRAEAEIYDRFLEITEGLTTILISHRFSTVRRADRIVVLEGGRIVEDGSHDQLMALGGRYAEMFRLQAERFAEGDL